MPEQTPSEIAREVLKRLAAQRIPPTPENFRDFYHQIAGTRAEETFPERQFKLIAHALPRANPEQSAIARQFEDAVASRAWPEFRTQLTELLKPASAGKSARVTPPAPDSWRTLVADTLEQAVGMLLIDTPDLAAESRTLARDMREGNAQLDSGLEERLKQFAYRVQWVAQDQSYIRQALLNLLQLLIENIAELVVDDKWLSGQMSVLLELFSRPLNKNTIEEMRERLRDVIFKQGTLKRSLSDAQQLLRGMLESFVTRLGELADTTGQYHDKVGAFAQRVGQAKTLEELQTLVADIVTETAEMAQRTRDSQYELSALRETVDHAYQEIARLEHELEAASELVRHDPLTGALNRKGLEETIAREISRMKRRGSVMCVGLLDVDDFKKLNDTLGHTAGDEALKHLANVVRETLRPQDSCGRYGGEEFVIVLPDTKVEDATNVLVRLQRELTRRFFLHENQKVLITFSAGVTQMIAGETADHAIERADKAMYRAKRAGKNRVETG